MNQTVTEDKEEIKEEIKREAKEYSEVEGEKKDEKGYDKKKTGEKYFYHWILCTKSHAVQFQYPIILDI